jgi:hypothetical protein
MLVEAFQLILWEPKDMLHDIHVLAAAACEKRERSPTMP